MTAFIIFTLLFVAPPQAPTQALVRHQTTAVSTTSTPTWGWSAPTVVAPAYDQYVGTQLLSDHAGNEFVLWVNFNNTLQRGIAYMRELYASNSSWGPIIKIFNSTYNTQINKITAAVDSRNNLRIVFSSDANVSNAGMDTDILYRSFDTTARTFSNVSLVSFGSLSTSDYPTVAVDNKDNMIVAWDESGTSAPTPMIHARYFDNATQLWGAIYTVSLTSKNSAQAPSVAFDSLGTAHLVWSDTISTFVSAIYFASFHRDGTTWDTPIQISTNDTAEALYPTIVVDQSNSIHVAWTSNSNNLGSGNDYDVYYRQYNYQDKAWEPVELVSKQSTVDVDYNIGLTVDLSGNVVIVWSEVVNHDGMTSAYMLFYATRPSYGPYWSNMVEFTFDINSNDFFPILTTDKFGFINLTFERGYTAFQLFFSRLGGMPYTPYLYGVNSAVDHGTVNLQWDWTLGAIKYNIYRSSMPINDISGMKPLATTSNQYYLDLVNKPSDYYYVITAVNGYGESAPSGMDYVRVLGGSVSTTTTTVTSNHTEYIVPITVTNFNTTNVSVAQVLSEAASATSDFPALPFFISILGMAILAENIKRKHRNR